MNQKAYSVLFSCLLATTFFHEFNAKGLAPSNPSLKALDRQKRATSAKPLTVSCPSDNLLVIQNKTAVFVIDINVNVFVLLNGTTGSGVCMSKNGTNGSHIPGGLWSAANETLEEFLESIEFDLSALLTISGSTHFNSGSVSTKILKEVTNIVIFLVAILDLELLANPTLALELILSVVGIFLELLGGPLKGLLDLVEGSIELTVDIFGLVNILQGLATVLKLVAGSLQKAITKGVKLELKFIIGAVDGLVGLGYLILQLGAAFDLAPLAGQLGNPESLCKLIAQLGGNVSVGFSGLFLVIGNLLAFISGGIEIEVFINILILFVAEASKNVPPNPLEELKKELSLILKAIGKVNATKGLAGCVTILQTLLNGTLTVGGINISGIINTLLAGLLFPPSGLLIVVVQIMILLTSVVNTSIGLPYLLLILISYLDSPLGIQHLLDLGIDLGRGVCICKLLSIIASEIGGLIRLIFTGNLYAFLANLPVIGIVVKALDAALNAASGGKLSLKTLLNLSELVKNLIKGLLQLVTGIRTGVQNEVVKQAKKVKDSCTSPSVLVHVNITIIIIGISN